MEIVLGVAVLLVAAAVIVVLVGRALPVAHVASRSATFSAPPERVWEALSDPQVMRSRWVRDVKFETIDSLPNRRLVRRVVGERSFGGTWTYEVESLLEGTRLTITENGEVYNTFFRFVSRYIVGHHRTINSFLVGLRRHLELAPA
jgi:hypothetical protein